MESALRYKYSDEGTKKRIKEIEDSTTLTPEEKKQQLFLNQKKTLDLFLERGAISQAQYDKSLGDLREKMGVKL